MTTVADSNVKRVVSRKRQSGRAEMSAVPAPDAATASRALLRDALQGRTIELQASIGMAIYPGDGRKVST